MGGKLNPTTTMLAKYTIDYAVHFKHHDQPHQHFTDDPVACEEVLSELLEHGFKIRAVLHDGVAMDKPAFDKLIKTAAGILTTRRICHSLGIDTIEAKHRFGSPA